MTRFSVKAAEPETELGDVIPTLDSDSAIAKSTAEHEPDTATTEISEHPVTLRLPKSSLHDSSVAKEQDHSPKEVRFDIARRESLNVNCKFLISF